MGSGDILCDEDVSIRGKESLRIGDGRFQSTILPRLVSSVPTCLIEFLSIAVENIDGFLAWDSCCDIEYTRDVGCGSGSGRSEDIVFCKGPKLHGASRLPDLPTNDNVAPMLAETGWGRSVGTVFDTVAHETYRADDQSA